jgi:hypothetical protein
MPLNGSDFLKTWFDFQIAAMSPGAAKAHESPHVPFVSRRYICRKNLSLNIRSLRFRLLWRSQTCSLLLEDFSSGDFDSATILNFGKVLFLWK